MTSATPLPQVLDGNAAKSLANASGLHSALVLGQPGGWNVLVRYGSSERAVAAQRSQHARLWRNLNTAVTFIRDELGMARFEVDASGHAAGAGTVKRPDQSERLRKQKAAADYDAYYRARVQEGRDAVARGDVLTEEEEEADFAKMMAEV